MEAPRFPINVRLVGVMQKEKTKLFMTSVLWSDQSEVVVFRSFREFKSMHKKMKKSFPSASKVTKSNRDIPRFRDKKLKQNSHRKGPNKSLVCLQFLQKYCEQLLTCDAKVTQSADLLQFFTPTDQDLQPEFTKNSIMIMSSEDEARTDGVQGSGGNVTTPFVTETYKCLAAYETKDTKNKPFKVDADEKLDVLIKDKAGWWLVEKENKQMAWFPAPYLVSLDEEEDDEPEEELDRGMLYTVIKSYKANKVDEITVEIGAVVEVLQRSENGWWLVRYRGKVGYIPTIHLQPYNNPHLNLNPHQQDSRPSSRPSSPLMLSPSSLHSPFSHGNLLHPSPSPFQFQPDSIQRSRSLEVLPQQSPPPAPAPPMRPDPAPAPPVRPAPAAPADGDATSTAPPPPIITVQMDEEQEEGRVTMMTRADSVGSFISDSTDFSFSDDFSSSSSSTTSSSICLSSRPPAPSSNLLSPTEGRLVPSVSDPNLYKVPKSPTVPPRPRTQDILSRCTTITRKNAAKGGLSPTQTPTQIISH
uniref:NADPH oxidase organizer 1a n=2 Tax=Gouania willdenowi TaxID=441366 RepID=A0A8C5GQN5_GOUWI